jgi:hypothetical protein
MDEAYGMDRSAEYLDEEAGLRETEGMKRGVDDLREGRSTSLVGMRRVDMKGNMSIPYPPRSTYQPIDH